MSMIDPRVSKDGILTSSKHVIDDMAELKM